MAPKLAYIDGKWVAAASGNTFVVENPATGATVATVTDCGKLETQMAIDAASRAFAQWRQTSVGERCAALTAIRDRLLQRKDAMAATLTAEMGKPLGEAAGEVAFAASFFQWYSEEARRAYGDTIPAPGTKRMSTIRQPVGVAGLITPWNFPIGMIGRKVSAALAAGCSCIIKPAEDTPLVALEFAEIIEACGLPAGLVNVLPCSRGSAPEVGAALCHSDAVRVLSFTGSTEVGKLLYAQCAGTLKKLSLELGGDAPFIVFPSADLDRAVEGAMAGKFRNTGQTCVTANRFLVHSSIAEQFERRLVAAMGTELKVGDGAKPGINQGPLINKRQHTRLVDMVKESISQGARLVVGGKAGPGLFYEPTVLSNCSKDTAVIRQEIFGPVVAIMTFETEEEAVTLANDSARGLAGYFYTTDLRQAHRVAERLEVGMVGVNESLVSTCEAPFGGVKHSGFGKEGSRHGLDEYSEIKYICVNIA